MKIETFVRCDFPVAHPFTDVNFLKSTLLKHSVVVVQDENQHWGVLTLSDMIQKNHILVADCLTQEKIISVDNSLTEALEKMKNEKTEVFSVYQEDKFIGLLFKNDILDFLQEHSNDLEMAISLKEKFYEIIAHDLRSPFNVLLGLTELLYKNIDSYSKEKIEKLAKQVYDSTFSTFGLLQNLLDWANSQRGNIQFSPQILNLQEVVEEKISILTTVALQKEIRLSHYLPDNCSVYADKNMLLSILRNLIFNAIKFTPRGGNVVVLAEPNCNFVQISVKDTGIGILPNVREKLFQSKELISTQGTLHERGTGLGLMLCKEFVEKHGGKIWVETELNEGSEFYFTVPQKKLF